MSGSCSTHREIRNVLKTGWNTIKEHMSKGDLGIGGKIVFKS